MAFPRSGWERARPWVAFVFAGMYGAVLWGTAPTWAGRKEPWDGAFGVYMVALSLGGLFALIAPRRPLAAPAGLVVGQVAWQIASGAGSLWPLSMILLSVLAVPAAVVGGVVWAIDRRRHPPHAMGQCKACGYDRRGLAERPCPECGAGAPAANA